VKSGKTFFVACILGSICLVALACIVGLVFNAHAKHGVVLLPKPRSGTEVIGTEKAALLFDEKTLFVDARSKDIYSQGHISGAYDLDFYELDNQWPSFAKKVGPQTPLIVYCEGISGEHNEDTCSTSRLLVEQLLQRGYYKAMLYEQGFAFWKKAGKAIDLGSESTHGGTPARMPLVNYGRDLIMLLIGLFALILIRDKRVGFVVQLLLGAVFIISASTKLLYADKLQVILEAYRILPGQLVPFAAACMPWIELLSGIALVTRVWGASGALVIAGMNMFFIPALAYRAMLLAQQLGVSPLGVNFDCGCGLGQNFAWVLVLRDAGFFMMAVAILVRNVKFRRS
jgi:rhodanese-related sulfurtransferase